MRHLLRAALPVKLGVILALAGTVAVFAAPPTDLPVPEVADDGQARVQAGAANGAEAAGQPDEVGTTGHEAQGTEVIGHLEDNHERLLVHLKDVRAALEERDNVNEHATEALQAVIDRLSNTEEPIGLLRAAEAVSGEGGPASGLPSATTGHPTADDHPGRP